MNDYIYQLNDYLPIDFGDSENNKYRKYVLEAYIENAENTKHQFSLLAFHLLFMGFIYKGFWILKKSEFPPLKSRCDRNAQLAEIQNMFDMSIFPEKNAIDTTMGALGFHVNQRSDVQNFVDTRDKCAHASGIIQYGDNDVIYHMSKALDYADRILKKKLPQIQNLFIKEVKDYWISDNFRYTLSVNFAENIICKIMLAPKEIEELLKIPKESILMASEGSERLSQEISFYIIMSVLQCRYMESSSCNNLDISNSYLFDSLLILMNRLSENERAIIQVELEDELNESEKYGTVPFDVLMSSVGNNGSNDVTSIVS